MPVTTAQTRLRVDRGVPQFHDTVNHLIADATLSRQEKIDILMRLQHEAKVSEMRGQGHLTAHLTLILQALHKLEANDFV